MAISVGEQPDTVEDVYEPFLIQQGMIARTPRGRVAMPAAYQHLGLSVPRQRPGQPGLFGELSFLARPRGGHVPPSS